MGDRDYDSDREEIIIAFGGAKVVRSLSGSYALRGGSDSEQKQAFDWVERFLPEATECIFKVKTETASISDVARRLV